MIERKNIHRRAGAPVGGSIPSGAMSGQFALSECLLAGFTGF